MDGVPLRVAEDERMVDFTPEVMRDVVAMFVQPWHDSLQDPSESQAQVLAGLLEGYSCTEYGRSRSAGSVQGIEQYRAEFPITDYDGYWPLIREAMATGCSPLLYEDVLAWAITRGTTQTESKFVPMTATDVRMRLCAGRALMNYVLRTDKLDILQGANLNLNFPSVIGTIQVGARHLDYGYSSGVYLKHTTSSLIRSIPTQQEIDALGGGKTIADWERRFELAYQLARDHTITFVGGVAPTAIAFARYLYQAHKVYPKDLWQVKVMTLGSVPGINLKYVPRLRAMYGPVDILEIYGATEGMFGQQLDEKRAWVPNYDLFLFEVETRRGIKLLDEMRPGETGSLVVSTPVLPRYRIGDLVKSYGRPYYRCIGRDRSSTYLCHWWDAVVAWDFGL